MRRVVWIAIIIIGIVFVVLVFLSGCQVLQGLSGGDSDTTPPRVVSVSPADGATGVPINTSIIIEFSETMDEGATEGAVTIVPSIEGTFDWSSQSTVLTYMPVSYLQENKTYTVKIDTGAKDLAGNRLEDAYIFIFETGGSGSVDNTPPSDVSNFVATGGNGQVELSWENPTDADFAGVKIMYRTDGVYPLGPDDGTEAYSGTGTSFVHTGLTNGTTYYYKIFTHDSMLNYSEGVTAQATPVASGSTPASPSGLTATTVSTDQIDLTWTDNSDNEDGFRIERKEGAGGVYTEIADIGANNTTYSDIGLSAGTTYYYRVKAYNAYGESGYSNDASATTQSGTGGGFEPDANTVVLWKLDGNGNDSSGNGYNLSFTANYGSEYSWVQGKYGQALSVNGAAGVNTWRCIKASGFGIPTGSFTIEGYYYLESIPNARAMIVSQYSPGIAGNDPFRLYVYNNGMLLTRLENSSGTVLPQLSYDVSGLLNQWVHVAFVYDSSTGEYSLFVNGSKVDSNTTTDTIRSTTSYAWYVGSQAEWVSDPIILDEIRISNVARYTATSYFEDFSNGLGEFTVQYGNSRVENGELRIVSTSGNRGMVTYNTPVDPTTQGPLVIECDARTTNSAEQGWIVWRSVINTNGHYYAPTDCVYLSWNSDYDQMVLSQYLNGAETSLDSQKIIDMSTMKHIKIIDDGTTVNVWIDGVLEFTGTPSGSFPGNYVGFMCRENNLGGGNYYVDNVSITYGD